MPEVSHEREDRRVASHLAGALTYLAARDLRTLSNRQRRERARLIRELEAYRLAGKYPRNRDFPGRRVPYFVDAEGISCAVAHLVRVSGGARLVDEVRESRNNARVVDLVPALAEFLEQAGLSVPEAARIQPQYAVPVEAPAAAWICQTPDGVAPAVGFTGRVVSDGSYDERFERLRLAREAPGSFKTSASSTPRHPRIEVDRVFGAAGQLPSRRLLAFPQSLEASSITSRAGRVYALVYAGDEQGHHYAELGRLKGEFFESDGVSIPIDEYLRLRTRGDCAERVRARYPTLGRFVVRGVYAASMEEWSESVGRPFKPRRLKPGEPLPPRPMQMVDLGAVSATTEDSTTEDGLAPPPPQDMFLFSKAAATQPDAGPAEVPTVTVPPEPTDRPYAALAALLAIPLGWFGWLRGRRKRLP